MTWYAIRTMPGAQMPQREYAVEETSLGADGRPRGKGYRIVPSLNPNMSAVERALSDAGFSYYMPVARRLIRDRRKPDLWKPRRFAMLLGYMFVRDVVDFRALEETPGVAGTVRNAGVPVPILESDIELLRAEEEIAEQRLAWDLQVRAERASRLTRHRAEKKFPKGSMISVTKGPMEGFSGEVLGTDRAGRVKALVTMLNAASTVSFPVDSILLVA